MDNILQLDNIYVMYVLVIVLFSYMIYAYIKNRKISTTLMSRDYTNNIKGLMAIIILLHHFALRISNIGVLKILKLAGLPAVTVFLFISGYVETIQYSNKGALYLKKYPLKKVFRIYLPWIISLLFFCIILKITSINTILRGLFMFKTVYRANTYNWFIIYLLYFYFNNYLIISYIEKAKKKIHNKQIVHLIYMIITALIWQIVCIYLKLPVNWFYNAYSPIFGIIFAYNYQKIIEIITKKRILKYILPLLVVVFFVLSNKISIGIISLLMYTIDAILISALTFYLSNLNSFKCTVFEFYGKISLEVFLYGTGIFIIYYSICKANAYGLLPIIAIITLLSYITNKISSSIVKKITIDK